jgi:hypothetical protein
VGRPPSPRRPCRRRGEEISRASCLLLGVWLETTTKSRRWCVALRVVICRDVVVVRGLMVGLDGPILRLPIRITRSRPSQ